MSNTSANVSEAQKNGNNYDTLKGIAGNESTTELIAWLNNVDWSNFDLDTQGYQLRNLLLDHNLIHGITEAHKLASSKLKTHLRLIHPYTHTNDIYYRVVSPDGRWLATADMETDDEADTGYVQIWEVETGRVVNTFAAWNGIGWQDYPDMVQWSPDSKLIAMAFSTNAIGVWNPFAANIDPILHADISNGNDRPSHFKWQSDSKHIIIDYPAPNASKQDLDNGLNSCVINIDGKKGLYEGEITPVKLDNTKDAILSGAERAKKLGIKIAGKKSIHEEALLAANNTLIIVKGRQVDFYNADNSLYATYLIAKDVSEEKGSFLGKEELRPYFNVKDATAGKVWILASPQGAIINSKKFDPSAHVSWTLGNKWYWPLNWATYLSAKSTEEIFQKNKELLPPTIRKQIETDISETEALKTRVINPEPSEFPTVSGKTFDDVINALLPKIEGNWIDGLRGLTASMLSDNNQHSLNMISRVKDTWIALEGSEIGFYYAKRCKGKDYEQYIEIAEKYIHLAQPEAIVATHASLAKLCYAVSIKEIGEPFEKYNSLFGHYSNKAENPDFTIKDSEHIAILADMYMMTGQIDRALQFIMQRNHQLYSNDYTRRLVLNAAQLCESMDDYLKLIEVEVEDDRRSLFWDMEAYNVATATGHAMARFNGAVDYIDRIRAIKYKMEWNKIEDAAATKLSNNPQAAQFFAIYNKPKNNYRLAYWLYNMTGKHRQIAIDFLNANEVSLASFQDAFTLNGYLPHAYYCLGAVYQLTNTKDSWIQEYETLKSEDKLAFLAGRASVMDATEATAVLEQAIQLLPGARGHIKLWVYKPLLRAALQSKSSSYEKIIAIALDATLVKGVVDKQLLDVALDIAFAGDFKTAYEVLLCSAVWKAEAPRRLLNAALSHKNYNTFIEFLGIVKDMDAKEFIRVIKESSTDAG